LIRGLCALTFARSLSTSLARLNPPDTEPSTMDEDDKVDWDDEGGDEEQTVFTFCKACNNVMRPQADSMTKVRLSPPTSLPRTPPNPEP
jgi:hypothetical protein